MKIAFPVRVIIIANNSVWRTYSSKGAFQKGGVVRTPYIIKDAKNKRIPLDEMYKNEND